MQPPYPPRPPYPPLPGPGGESDRDLVARLTGPDDARRHAVALLLARHWRAARDYAVVCLASFGPAAPLVATAAFHEVLGRMAGGAVGGALRPQLLVAVRDTVRAWAADDGTCASLPELRKPTGGRGLRTAKPGTPERRQLAERAFRALPGASQCLLWHTEVEAEPINIPAGLLGIGPAVATAALDQAREQFRAGCVRAHRELAPTKECRFYNRLLDVPMRRGGALLPDVRQHLTACPYCRDAADTIGRFEGGLDLMLAETVLGWGARRYLDSRPGRGPAEDWPPAPDPARTGAGGRHRTGPDGRRRTALLVGVGLASLALLATVLVARSWSDDNGVPVPGATWGAPAGRTTHTTHPGRTGAGPGTGPSAGSGGPDGPVGPAGPAASAASVGSVGLGASVSSVGEPVEVARGSLRGLGSGRCLDVREGRVEAGAGIGLAPYVVPSAGCVVHAGEVAYDITVRGEILLRRHAGPALATGAGPSDTVVGPARRDGSPGQLWVLEPGAGGPGPADVPPGAPGGPDTMGVPGASDEAGPPRSPDEFGGVRPGRPEGDDGRGGTGGPAGPGVPGMRGQLGEPGQSQRAGRPDRSGDGDETRIAQVRAGRDQGRTGSGSAFAGGVTHAVSGVFPPNTGAAASAASAPAVAALLG
ncbi:hydrolase [Streptomyces sp. FXJ1.172]|uniref:hypothetical protein n=1 Tax=Streptomyces sp. FXJ1.172 TaxID=710705 RepID=UPI0007CFE365|nr:hypothetical protein [Streptomyces sp. FXJ1.172]WEO98742.1 hydrolase [Streptomyces sp. FXJ1.172]